MIRTAAPVPFRGRVGVRLRLPDRAHEILVNTESKEDESALPSLSHRETYRHWHAITALEREWNHASTWP